MKKLILCLIISLALILIKDNQILAAEKATAEVNANVELKEAQEQELLVTNYINNLNELLNSVDSPEKEQRIKEKLNSCIGLGLSSNKIILQFFEHNRERFLKFIDEGFLAKLILFNELELLKIFLCRDNVNTIINYITRSTTLLIEAVHDMRPEMVEVILETGADVNQIILDTYYGGTALARLILQEATFRNEGRMEIELEEGLNKIRKIAKMLFHAGADINLGGKIKKDYWIGNI